MRSNPKPLLRPVLGGLLLAATLALTPLGVQVARADSPATDWRSSPLFSLGGVRDSDHVSQCRPGQAPTPATSRSNAMAQVMARVRAELAAGGDPGIALNSRGFNYRNAADPWVELERIRREARQLQH